MKVVYDKTSTKPMVYGLWLSSSDTHKWATRANKQWPCSECQGKPLFVGVDGNGLHEFSVDGRLNSLDIDAHELQAIVADHLPVNLRHLWPCWE